MNCASCEVISRKKKPFSSLALLSPSAFIWALDPGAEISKCIRGKFKHSQRCRMVGGKRRLRGKTTQCQQGGIPWGGREHRWGEPLYSVGVLWECIYRLYPEGFSKPLCLCVWLDNRLTLPFILSCLSHAELSDSFSFSHSLIHLSHAQTLSWTLSAEQACNSTPRSFVPFFSFVSFHLFQLSGDMGFFDGTETSVIERGDERIPKKKKSVRGKVVRVKDWRMVYRLDLLKANNNYQAEHGIVNAGKICCRLILYQWVRVVVKLVETTRLSAGVRGKLES